jgi:hypothetical protein
LKRLLLVGVSPSGCGFGMVTDDRVDCNLEAMPGRVTGAHGAWYDLGKDLVQINFSGWVHGPVLGVTYAF